MAFKNLVHGRAEGGDGFFSATYWTRLSAEHWEVPLALVGLYLVMVPTLQRYVARYGRWDVRRFAFYWNASLSIYSLFGVLACVPTIIWSLTTHRIYFTTCAPGVWYRTGMSGFFVALFIYSKIVELVDTVLLILAGKPVVILQWWHHSTTLLYCWHSYIVRIATGAWFAGMNYAVHSLMYAYFALMGSKYRKVVSRFAVYITMLQLLQMVGGIFVTFKAVLYQMQGLECNVNRTNSILGLTMYPSFFVLFALLFVDNYLVKPKQRRNNEGSQKCVEDSSGVPRGAQSVFLTLFTGCLFLFVIEIPYKVGFRESLEKPSEFKHGGHSVCTTTKEQPHLPHENAQGLPTTFESDITSTASQSTLVSSDSNVTDDAVKSQIVCQEDMWIKSNNLVKCRGDRS